MVLPKNGSVNRSLLRPTLFIYNVYKVQNSINHMLNPSADRDINNNYRLSTEKARQWWANQAFESRKNIVIESEAVINEDELVEDQIIADIAGNDYDNLPDVTKQEVDLQVEDEEKIEEVFNVDGQEYLQCSTCDDLFTSNEDYDIHKSVDHGEEPVDIIEETYRISINKDLTKESIRDANTLLTETEERELYAGYSKTNGITPRVMPPNQRVKGKYDNNPNEFFYSNKIFRNGSSTERNSALGEAMANEYTTIKELYEIIEPIWNSSSENEKKKIIINTLNAWTGQDDNLKLDYMQLDHMTKRGIASNWDNAFNPFDENRKRFFDVESKANEGSDEIAYWWDGLSPYERESQINQYGVGNGLYDGDYNKTYSQIENDGNDGFNISEINAVFTNNIINKQTGLDRNDLIKNQSGMGLINGMIPSNSWDDTEYNYFYRHDDKGNAIDDDGSRIW